MNQRIKDKLSAARSQPPRVSRRRKVEAEAEIAVVDVETTKAAGEKGLPVPDVHHPRHSHGRTKGGFMSGAEKRFDVWSANRPWRTSGKVTVHA